MELDRLDADVQLGRCLPVGPAGSGQPGHRLLGRGEAGQRGAISGPASTPGTASSRSHSTAFGREQRHRVASLTRSRRRVASLPGDLAPFPDTLSTAGGSTAVVRRLESCLGPDGLSIPVLKCRCLLRAGQPGRVAMLTGISLRFRCAGTTSLMPSSPAILDTGLASWRACSTVRWPSSGGVVQGRGHPA